MTINHSSETAQRGIAHASQARTVSGAGHSVTQVVHSWRRAFAGPSVGLLLSGRFGAAI